MFSQNLYDDFNSCFESYQDYIKKNYLFLTEFFPVQSFLETSCKISQTKSSLEVLLFKLEGVEGSGKMTLARHLFHCFNKNSDLEFAVLSNFPWKKNIAKKLFLYASTETLKSKKDYSFLQELLKTQKIHTLVLAGEDGSFLNIEKKFDKSFDCEIVLPSFPERVSDHLLLLSYFFSELSSLISLTKEALCYYAEKKPAKTVFDLKYACLWSYHQALKLSERTISKEIFEEAFYFVNKNKEDFLIIEEVDFFSLANLVGKVSYKKLLNFQDNFLIEMIMRSQKTYTQSSRYTGLPVTTIRSKRLKFLKPAS
jgi:hypothetical protein